MLHIKEAAWISLLYLCRLQITQECGHDCNITYPAGYFYASHTWTAPIIEMPKTVTLVPKDSKNIKSISSSHNICFSAWFQMWHRKTACKGVLSACGNYAAWHTIYTIYRRPIGGLAICKHSHDFFAWITFAIFGNSISQL